MVEWRDMGVVISTYAHGEGGLIVNLLTADRGRHAGMVRGTKKHAALCQPGNLLELTWKARLEDQLGSFSLCEADTLYGASIMTNREALLVLNSLCVLIYRLLPERDPYPNLYHAIVYLLDVMRDEPDKILAEYVRFELLLLQEMGHGLNLDHCADTGVIEDLVYVSPKSGSAICQASGFPYKERLLPLPAMLNIHAKNVDENNLSQIVDGLRLTGYFLESVMQEFYHIKLPDARADLVRMVAIKERDCGSV